MPTSKMEPLIGWSAIDWKAVVPPVLFAVGALIWAVVGLWQANEPHPVSLRAAAAWLLVGWIFLASAITIRLASSRTTRE